MSFRETSGRPGLVLSAVGPDRPGLVFELSGWVRRVGGNIEDTRMAKLGGEFAVLVLVTGPESALSELRAALPKVEEQLGLACNLRDTTQGTGGEGLHYKLAVTGLDRPGIVSTVTDVLVKRSVNVTSLSSKIAHAPLTGTPMFVLDAELQVPPSTNPGQLRRELGEACERENLDFSLDPGRT